jgi:hypothetical protein
VCLPLAFKHIEYAGTNFHKQNSAFLSFYESGSRRLLRVSGVGFLYLFQLRIPNLLLLPTRNCNKISVGTVRPVCTIVD